MVDTAFLQCFERHRKIYHKISAWIWPSQEIVLISKPPQQGNRKPHVGKTKQNPSHKTSTQKQNKEDTEKDVTSL